jgi:hypothetical protein
MKITKYLLTLPLIITMLYNLYFLKSAMGISLTPWHFGSVVEKTTLGIVKCQWLYNPHHCK